MSDTVPSPDELVRRVLAALGDRTLALVHGTRVPLRVAAVPGPGDTGLTVGLTTLDGRRPALWILPAETWQAWRAAWEATSLPDTEEAGDKALMSLLTAGLDRWQTLAGGEGTLPGFPFPGTWDPAGAPVRRRIGQDYAWFEVRTPAHRAWVGLGAGLTATGPRLAAEAGFRAQVREQVLGEATGRLAGVTAWEPSRRGPLTLGDDFVLGPCLLPAFPLDGVLLRPRFLAADPEAGTLAPGESLLVRRCGWEGQSFPLVYRVEGTADPEAWYLALVGASGGLLPFGTLLGLPPEPDTWELADGLAGSTASWLTVTAELEPGGPAWTILIPAELLNALSSSGVRPWNWVWLTAGADNLLRVFLDVNDRLRWRPPAGLGPAGDREWAARWYELAEEPGPPEPVLTVADLWEAAPPRDRTLLVQNVLVPDRSLHPLVALFTWAEDDPVQGLVPFQMAGFDRNAFAAALPPLAREDWERRIAEYQSREDCLAANGRALAAVWEAWRRGRLELSPPTVGLLREGYAAGRKLWRERRVREMTGRGIGPWLDRFAGDPDLGPALQRDGARALALALLADPAAGRVAELTSRAFAAEFGDQRKAWAEALRDEGPDPEAFGQALGRLNDRLARLGQNKVP